MEHLIIQQVSLYRLLDSQRTEDGEIPEDGAFYPIPDGYYLHSAISAEPSLVGLQGQGGTVKNTEWLIFAPKMATEIAPSQAKAEEAVMVERDGKESKTKLMSDFMLLWEMQNPRENKTSERQLHISKKKMKMMLIDTYGLKFPSALTKKQLKHCIEVMRENVRNGRIDPIE